MSHSQPLFILSGWGNAPLIIPVPVDARTPPVLPNPRERTYAARYDGPPDGRLLFATAAQARRWSRLRREFVALTTAAWERQREQDRAAAAAAGQVLCPGCGRGVAVPSAHADRPVESP